MQNWCIQEKEQRKRHYTETGNDYAAIPKGFTVSKIASEQTISNGLVIYYIPEGTAVDWSDADTLRQTYDQFVWIPVNNPNDMFICQAKTANTSCDLAIDTTTGQPYCKNHTGEGSTKMAGRLYATTDGDDFDPTLTTQTYSANSGLREPAITTTYDSNTENLEYLQSILGTTGYDTANNFLNTLQTEYNNIAKSVIQNKGFWVGRYETSMNVDDVVIIAGNINIMRAANNEVNLSWYNMYARQKLYAKNKDLLGGMISGAAFDQMLIYVDRIENGQSAVKIGNHVEWGGSANFSIRPYKTGGVGFSQIYSGTVNGGEYGDIWNNIYDVEGNISEYTIEASGAGYRVTRGRGQDIPGAVRRAKCVSRTGGYMGSRMTLYIP